VAGAIKGYIGMTDGLMSFFMVNKLSLYMAVCPLCQKQPARMAALFGLVVQMRRVAWNA